MRALIAATILALAVCNSASAQDGLGSVRLGQEFQERRAGSGQLCVNTETLTPAMPGQPYRHFFRVGVGGANQFRVDITPTGAKVMTPEGNPSDGSPAADNQFSQSIAMLRAAMASRQPITMRWNNFGAVEELMLGARGSC